MGETSRRRQLVAIVIVAVVFLALGLLAGRLVQSPAQQALTASPPPRTGTTDTVQRSKVRSSLALGAMLGPVANTSVTARSSGDQSGPLVYSDVRVAEGGQVKAGQVVLEVSGRPVMVLPGAVPAYRSLGPGDSGPDVRELQAALRGMGLDVDDDQTFGPTTRTSVAELYRRIGYVPVTVGVEQVNTTKQALDAAEDADFQARDAVDQAKLALTRARSTTPPPPSDAASIADAQHNLALARRTASRAAAALAEARAAHDEATAQSGVSVPLGEIVFVQTLPATARQVAAHVGGNAEGTAMTLASGELVATTDAVESNVASDVKVGMTATVMADDGTDHPATVTRSVRLITSGPADAGQTSEPTNAYVVTPRKPLPAGLAGQPVRVVITIAETAQPVLNVAMGAVRTDAAGRASIVRRNRDGSKQTIAVTAGAQGDGRVQVTPVEGSDLKEGDTVLIGGDS